MAESGRRLNARASGVIALAVMLSRILGLVREVLFAGLFGTSLMGVFTVAFRAPNLLRDLFAEGALSTAFVTVFSKEIEKQGREAAWRLASKMLTLAGIFMSGVSLMGVLFAERIIGLLAMGFPEAEAALVVELTRIMFPFILMVSLAALVMGILNSVGFFGLPALASSFFNIGSIAGGLVLGWAIDPEFGERALIGLAVGTLFGGFLQVAIQLPGLWRAGYRYRLDFGWNDSGVREILGLMLPSVIAASAVQVNVMVNTGFASFVGSEAVAWLNFAFRLMQLPLGMFGVAVATITLPVVSRIAAGGRREEFGETLGSALRLIMFFTLPSAFGLVLLAEPIVSVIYERGEFRIEDTRQTAAALRWYALGLVAYSGIKVLSPAFYAIGRRWTPMLVSFGAIGLNFLLNLLFIFHLRLGHQGLALATSLAATLNFFALFLLMRMFVGSLTGWKILINFLKCGGACFLMALGVESAVHLGGGWFENFGFIGRCVFLVSVVPMAALIYVGVCWLMRVDEVRQAWMVAKEKILRLQGRLGGL